MNPLAPVAQAHANAGPTELAAAARASIRAGSLRGKALLSVVASGDRGLTVPEALEALRLPERRRYSLAPRFPELLHEGYVRKGEVREDHVAYVATEAGRAWAAREAAMADAVLEHISSVA